MQGDVAKPGMATDSRGHAPGDELQTDIPSVRLINGRDDDPLEYRGETGDISRSGVQIPPTPLLLRPNVTSDASVSEWSEEARRRRVASEGFESGSKASASERNDRGSHSLRPHTLTSFESKPHDGEPMLRSNGPRSSGLSDQRETRGRPVTRSTDDSTPTPRSVRRASGVVPRIRSSRIRT